MPLKPTARCPRVFGSTSTASSVNCRWVASRSCTSRSTPTTPRWRSRNTCPTPSPCAPRARSRPGPRRQPGRLSPTPQVLLRGGPGARSVAPECGAGARLLPRQRLRLYGDAVRARQHAPRLRPEAPRRTCARRLIRAVFVRMLNGLREVHAHKLLHLDIKPSNIYLRADGTPVLLDFGAARQTLLSDTPILKPMYTPGFASPEQFTSRETLGPWSDIYSVGASLHACLVGSVSAALRQAGQGRQRCSPGQDARQSLFAVFLAARGLVPSTRCTEASTKCLCLAEGSRSVPPGGAVLRIDSEPRLEGSRSIHRPAKE